MGKTIDSDVLRQRLNEQLGCYSFCSKVGKDVNKVIDSVPSVNESHGEAVWLPLTGYWNRVRCSACGGENVQKTPFCPFCGFKMKLE